VERGTAATAQRAGPATRGEVKGQGGLPQGPRWRRWWARTARPVRIGILFGLIGAALAAAGLARGASEPLSWRGVAMAIALAGGSWGLVSWAMATAIMEDGRDREHRGEE